MIRNSHLLQKKRAGLIVIDIQKKLLAVMQDPSVVVENSIKLIKGFKLMDLPVFATEQYPEGLGPTDLKIRKVLGDIEISTKLAYSCCGIKSFKARLRAQKIDQLVICGIESHVCVWQTAMDLLDDGFQVQVAADATSSRKMSDHDNALKRMMQAGIVTTTVEMALFELLEVAEGDVFKKLLKVIK